jgi:NAD dependent epimerase/dehydratase family enzyme
VERIQRRSEQGQLGNGQSYTNFVHRDDAVSAIVWSLENDLEGIYNVVNDTHVRRKDLYSALRNLHHLPEAIWDEKKVDTHSGNKKVSNAKLKNTGFLFAHPEFFGQVSCGTT